jgi:hypothetical protein
MSPPASPPALTGEFTSTSSRTVLQYYRYTGSASFRGVIAAPAGFDQVEVLQCGFRLSTQTHVAPLKRAAVNVQKFTYDAFSGQLEVGVFAQLDTDGQDWEAEVTFVVILTDAAAATFTRISSGCRGQSECTITRLLPGAIPAGKQFVGVGTQIWGRCIGIRACNAS